MRRREAGRGAAPAGRYRKIGTYSLGMKQLAKLAQAIAHGPGLIFLDEPTNGLDPPARQRMIELIRQIRDSGKAHIVLSSHLLRDVEECCEEILIIKQGRIAVYCNLEDERRSNLKFLEIETRGDREGFVEAIAGLGCEYALTSERRLRGNHGQYRRVLRPRRPDQLRQSHQPISVE
jgi:ABC-2 type transport system ATP-binding protein